MKEEIETLVKELRNSSYQLPDLCSWYDKDGIFMPNNICTVAADCILILEKEISSLRAQLETEQRKKKWRLFTCQ